jgi:hypothetical protein
LRARNGRSPPCDLQNGPQRIDHQLGSSSIDPAHTPSKCENQAPDDRAESDLEFFTARPNVDSRVRLPFENEFDELLAPGAFVHVVLVRDPETGEPRTRGRAVFYSDLEGGNA